MGLLPYKYPNQVYTITMMLSTSSKLSTPSRTRLAWVLETIPSPLATLALRANSTTRNTNRMTISTPVAKVKTASAGPTAAMSPETSLREVLGKYLAKDVAGPPTKQFLDGLSQQSTRDIQSHYAGTPYSVSRRSTTPPTTQAGVAPTASWITDSYQQIEVKCIDGLWYKALLLEYDAGEKECEIYFPDPETDRQLHPDLMI